VIEKKGSGIAKNDCGALGNFCESGRRIFKE